MNEPNLASDYDDRGAQAAHAVLIELGQILGAHRDAIVVIGGSVPSLLLPNAEPSHIGSLDIDLDLDPEELSEHGYAELIEKFADGPEALASACAPLLEDPVAREGYLNIAGKFNQEDGFGPETVRRFVEGSGALGDMTPDQIRTDAFRQVRAWLKALELVSE